MPHTQYRTAAVKKQELYSRCTNVGDPDKCWEWQGNIDSRGYGGIRWANNPYTPSDRFTVHLLSFTLHHNRFPMNYVLHKCNNKICVNPDHLYEGTASDNAKDRVKSGKLVARNKPPMDA